ncbi:beta-Ala-His dipeptidase [Candidatus Thorarchaeota archaeon]|nr:MAG: beta-Ala-His dipeptidase [Candidatus Thorarchaeota archaeon]
MVLEKLKPEPVWEIFEHVFTVTPRESKKEDKIRAKIRSWVTERAESSGIEIEIVEDSVGNLLLKKGPTKGMEDTPPLLLQGHMDMVCETDRKGGFDFDNAPIPVRIQENGEWVDADGTTLGADNGIGVALALALLIDPDALHGPLEVLITVDEETGLVGAFSLNPQELGIESKLLINVDSEQLGLITIGSAGGGDTKLSRVLDISTTDSNLTYYELSISGLLGGHSGVDIHKHRANANKLIARMLIELGLEMKVFLSSWEGGSKHNAITRESTVRFAIPAEKQVSADELLHEASQAIIAYYKNESKRSTILEPDLQIKWKQVEQFPVCSSEESHKIILTIDLLRQGPINVSPYVKDLVETSNNVAIIKTEGELFTILISTRSSVDAELESYRNQVEFFASQFGWDIERKEAYPGWNPAPSSPFLKFVQRHYEQVLKTEVQLRAIHAGLECGIIGAKIPGIQMVSIGPTALNAHTPDEKLRIADIPILYDLLKSVASELKNAEL